MTEKSFTKPYIDADGVRRGWNVYLHRDNATNQVFYVGMGIYRRAWDEKKRNNLWKAKVAGLKHGFSVEILKNDLSEIEAENLEKETVEQYGGIEEGSPLTNKIPGGRLGIVISLEDLAGSPDSEKLQRMESSLSVELMDDPSRVRGLLKLMLQVMDDEQLRDSMNTLAKVVEEHGPNSLEKLVEGYKPEKFDFISGTREEQLQLLNEFYEKHEELLSLVLPIADVLADSPIHTVSVVGCGIYCEMNTVDLAISDFQCRRISWEDFCEELSSSFQSIRYDVNEMHDELQELDEVIEADLDVFDNVLTVYLDLLNKITV